MFIHHQKQQQQQKVVFIYSRAFYNTFLIFINEYRLRRTHFREASQPASQQASQNEEMIFQNIINMKTDPLDSQLDINE